MYFFTIARRALHLYSCFGSSKPDEVHPRPSRAHANTFSPGGLGRFPRAAKRDRVAAPCAQRVVVVVFCLCCDAAGYIGFGSVLPALSLPSCQSLLSNPPRSGAMGHSVSRGCFQCFALLSA